MEFGFTSHGNHANDPEIDYILEGTEQDYHFARSGVNHQFLKLDGLTLAGNTVNFTIGQAFTARLEITREGRIQHRCNCHMYVAHNACEHVFWAIDQIARVPRPQIGGVVIETNRSSFHARASPQDRDIVPSSIVRHYGSAVEHFAEQHLPANVRFQVVKDRVLREAGEILLLYTEKTLLESTGFESIVGLLSIGRENLPSIQEAHRRLGALAEDLLMAFKAKVELLQVTNRSADALSAVANEAAQVYLWMMRNLVLHTGTSNETRLRAVAARAFYDEADGDFGGFWRSVDSFFEESAGFGVNCRVELRALQFFMERTQEDPVVDEQVSLIMGGWLASMR